MGFAARFEMPYDEEVVFVKMILTLQERKNVKKRDKWILAIVYSVIFILLLFCFYAERINRSLSDSMIRLHIVANSDSDADQALKYRVRDAVIAYMTERVGNLDSKQDARTYINDHIDELQTVANTVIADEGFHDLAKVTIGKYPFPTKRYENIILPAGFYDAVKIQIGKAQGENWWCVMFPPLCFVDDTKGEMEEEYMNVLKDELTSDEMDLILATGEGDEIPVEIKFRIVEIFQNSKMKLAGLFRGIISFD
jgi:stage II sporulation protein R